MGATAWGLGNTPSGIGGTKLEYTDPVSGIKANYKYLTTAQVIDGKVVLHKTVLSGIPKVVYLNGSKGVDTNDGSTAKNAVKTFARAAELLGTDDGLKTIYVTNAVTISKDEAWALAGSVNGTVKRYNTFTGALINVSKGASLTLSNIIIDGGKEENTTATNSLVTVQSGGSFTISEGAVLQNNNKTFAGANGAGGGAVHNQGTLTINGGKIQNNQAVGCGGGVYSLDGTVVMTSGEVSGNKTTSWSGSVSGHSKSTGGGICIATGSMEMRGGTIANNITNGYRGFGGGIALGDCANRTGMKLTMTGGTVEGNTAKGNGGGIAVWSGGSAEISGGLIQGNTANHNANVFDIQETYFGGGGVYVNKGAELTLKTVEVTGNTTAMKAYGLAVCPTSDVKVYVKNGGVFHGTSSSIYVATLSGQFRHSVPISIAEYTLNGYKYNWNDGTVGPEDLNQVLQPVESLTLMSGLTDPQGAEAATFCDLQIIGNKSEQGHGGGIGCNGTLIIGEVSSSLLLEKKVDGAAAAVKADKEFDFTLAFTTGDGNPYSGSVTFWEDGAEHSVSLDENGELNLTLEAGGYVLFRDLPVGVKYAITEGENHADMIAINRTTVTDLDNLDSYKNPTVTPEDVQPGPSMNGTVVDGIDEVVYTNVYDTIGLTVKKVVAENGDKEKEFPFEIQLLKQDGELYYATNATEGEDDMIGLPVSIPYTITGGEKPIEGKFAFEGSVESFKLADGQSITLTGLPVGATALITELDEGREGYWTMVDLDGEPQMSSIVGVQTSGDHAVTFTNTPYDPDTIPIPFAKSISGDPETVPAFRFTLTEGGDNDKTGYVLPESTSVTLENVTNEASGSGSFNIKFTKAGTYQFIIAEDISDAAANWTYDAAKWTVTVEVTKAETEHENEETGEVTFGNGFKAEITKVEKDGVVEESKEIKFSNTYTPPPSPQPLPWK